ncbi:sugar ABC transporter substrate-binding protein [Paraburkholderia sp. B3]|uniref:sugar ABC transporter substrate-binding protein n=1 Tax=Paraburkholderia sp. B3 TaxID=3134791 RepID=UPI003982CDFD
MKRYLMALVAGAVLATSSAARAEKIGVSMSAFDDNFLTVVRSAMSTDAAKRKDVSLQFEDAQNDVGKQLNQIQNFIAQKVDAIIVNPVDTDATPKMTKLAAAAGIPLVYVNRMPSDKQLPPKVSFVGSNEVESGTLEMSEVCRLMGGKGSILVMIGDLANQAARQRTQDIKNVIAKPPCNGIKIVDARSANWQRTDAVDLMNNWLSAGLSFDAIVSNDDEMALGAIQALKSAGKFQKGTIVAGIDATQDALASMKAGDLKVTVFQNGAAQGADAVETALKLARGQKVDTMVWIPFELVTPANLPRFASRN